MLKLSWLALLGFAFAVSFSHDCARAQLKAFDPATLSRKLGEGARDVDSEARELGRELDETLRELIPDPEKKLSEAAYEAYKAFVVNKQVKVRVVRLQEGDFHFDQIAPLLPKVKIQNVTFYFDAFVPADMAAVTFGHKIYVDQSYDPESEELTRLLAHELVHVGQYDYLGGEKKFAHRYFGQIAKATRGRILRGQLDVRFLHDDLGLEREANSYERLVPDYNYRKFEVDAEQIEALTTKQLKQDLEGMSANQLGATLMQIDGPTLRVGLINIDGKTLQVAVDKMDMPTLREGMIRVDGATLKEILKRLHPAKRKFIMWRLDDATRRETEKYRDFWRN